MGCTLALNISKKHKLHLYNGSYSKVRETIDRGKSGTMIGYTSILEMTRGMETPRTIITSEAIKHTVYLLSPGDTIIDCANEHYTQSTERESLCNQFQINYLGLE